MFFQSFGSTQQIYFKKSLLIETFKCITLKIDVLTEQGPILQIKLGAIQVQQ